MGADAFDRGPDRRLLAHDEIVEHDHVARSQRGERAGRHVQRDTTDEKLSGPGLP